MNISVDLIKELRDMTMASLKDCKECLIEAQWDIEKAKELLKKKWLASAMKKWDRETKEWKFGYKIKWNHIGICKLGSETDFVAKNDLFVSLIQNILDIVIDQTVVDYDSLDDSKKDKIEAMVWETVGQLGENMKVSQLLVKEIPAENAYVYLHAWDKLIAVVYYSGTVDEEAIKKVALQIAAMDPEYLDISHIPVEVVEKMKKDYKEEVLASGKPEGVADNIVNGKLNKKYGEIVLLEQWYIGDESKKIKDIIGDVKIVWYDRMSF